MSDQLDITGIRDKGALLYADNNNEEIDELDLRTLNNIYSHSFPVLNDVASISGVWAFTVLPTIPLVPTLDAHPISKKHFDLFAATQSGDVTGGSSSTNNGIVRFDGETGKLIKEGSSVSINDTGDMSGVGNIGFSTSAKTIAGIENVNLLDKTSNETIASGAVWTFTDSPIVPDPTTGLQAANRQFVLANSGSGDVTKVNTPVNNQVAVWTGDGTVEGDANLTFSGSTLTAGSMNATDFNGVPLSTAGATTAFLSEAGTYITPVGGGDLLASNNLSDVASLTTTQANLAAQDWDFQGNNLTTTGEISVGTAGVYNRLTNINLRIRTSATQSLQIYGNVSAVGGAGSNAKVAIQGESASVLEESLLIGGNTSVDIGAIAVTTLTSRIAGASLSTRPTLAGYNYTTKQWEVAANGNWDFQGNEVGNISKLTLNQATEDTEFVDAGSTSASEQDWIEVTVGGNTGYIRVFATK